MTDFRRTDFRQENIDWFKRYDPSLLLELADVADSAELTATSEDVPGLAIEGVDLHDPDRPQAEARSLLGSQPRALHLHFGFGLGYYLEADRPAQRGHVLIFEPDPRAVWAAFRARPLAPLMVRATLCCSFQRFHYLALKLKARRGGWRFFVSPRHRTVYNSAFRVFQELLAGLDAAMVIRGGSTMFPTMIQATLSSLADHVASPDVALWSQTLTGKPAVLVAAGPSLARNLAELLPYRARVVLFAVARTVKTLERFGIEPDFVVHVEAQDFYHFIEGCRNLDNTTFLLADQADTRYYRFPCRARYVFQSRLNPLISCLRARHPESRRLLIKTGGSVATAAFYLAWQAGCNPIVLVGQDLAAGKGRWYADEQGVKAQVTRKLAGYHGGRVLSLDTYHTNLIWYERSIPALLKEAPERVVINATEGGALIGGVPRMKLKEAARTWFKQTLEPVTPTVPPPAPLDTRPFLAELAEFLEALRSARQSLPETQLLEALARQDEAALAALDGKTALATFTSCFQPHWQFLLPAECATAKLLSYRGPGETLADRLTFWAALAAIYQGVDRMVELVRAVLIRQQPEI